MVVAVPVKYLLDEFARQADGVEDLRATIGLVGGDAHLGHHLQDALAHGLDVILLHFIRLERQTLAHPNLFERFKGKIGVNRFRAITCQGAEVMDFTCFTSFHNHARLHAQALPHQMMMHGRGRQKRRDWNAIGR